MCFAVCAPLQAWLEAGGVESNLITADFPQMNHVWLELSDGRILDPTADQFGLEPVYLGALPAVYARWMDEARTADAVRLSSESHGTTTRA